MPRVRVDIKWDPVSRTFRAFDETSGKPIAQYANLTYGDTPASQAGTADDAPTALTTFKDATLALNATTGKQQIADPSPAIAASVKGWASIP